jgi:hypothetical protein
MSPVNRLKLKHARLRLLPVAWQHCRATEAAGEDADDEATHALIKQERAAASREHKAN